jgi:hypothetical protein
MARQSAARLRSIATKGLAAGRTRFDAIWRSGPPREDPAKLVMQNWPDKLSSESGLGWSRNRRNAVHL